MKRVGFSQVVRGTAGFLLITALPWALRTLDAEKDKSANAIHTIFVASAESGSSSEAVRNRVVERLKKTGKLRIVADEASADAVLRVNAVIWPSGVEMPNPRSRNVSVTSFQGYASAELVDQSKQPLWSYLATPGRFHLTSTTNDLAEQLSANLVLAVDKGIEALPASAPPAGDANVRLKIAGATFPAPLYAKWFEAFRQEAHGFPVSYDAIGSENGLAQLRQGSIDVAASDIAPSSQPDGEPKIQQFPSVVGGVVAIYNLAGIDRSALNFTPDLLAQIYSGAIVRWNDPRIQALNRGVHLPNAAIAVIHRSDGSGTTYIWTTFLSQASKQWKSQAGATIEWPVGAGVAGSEGMVKQVAQVPDSIGYVELTYAIQYRASYAAVRNRSGRFIKPDLTTLAAAAVSQTGASGRVPASILDSPRPDAYPIATFTWFLVPEQSDPAKRKAIADLLHWVLTSGQRQCSSLAYAPLPPDVIREELREVDSQMVAVSAH